CSTGPLAQPRHGLELVQLHSGRCALGAECVHVVDADDRRVRLDRAALSDVGTGSEPVHPGHRCWPSRGDPMTRYLLMVSAIIEAGTGVTLLAWPSLPVSLLFGAELDSPTASAVGRVAGSALLALGVACWLALTDEHSPTARGLIVAMLQYNT